MSLMPFGAGLTDPWGLATLFDPFMNIPVTTRPSTGRETMMVQPVGGCAAGLRCDAAVPENPSSDTCLH